MHSHNHNILLAKGLQWHFVKVKSRGEQAQAQPPAHLVSKSRQSSMSYITIEVDSNLFVIGFVVYSLVFTR